MRFFIFSIILFALLVLTACQPAKETPVEPLIVENAWVRAMPPGRSMTAAYGEFKNSGSTALKISEFSSPQFSSVSLHETIIDSNGMSHMQELHEMILQAGEVMLLEPGAKHLMLMGRLEGQAGEPGSITINFEMEKSDHPVSIEFILK